ncbi:MAG: thioesterase family protein [Deltaproteobacteria bacterium]|nr:thioesterase family protein [Deltaproteobacteria bacterium]
MKPTLQPGLTFAFSYTVPSTKTVPHLYPESEAFRVMPEVFATGFMVGLVEWACIDAINPHLDWPAEQSVGTHVGLTHEAATPPGLRVTVAGRLASIDGRKLTFEVSAHDGVDTICRGRHERVVVDVARFTDRLARKRP